jgi:hypothetical protein
MIGSGVGVVQPGFGYHDPHAMAPQMSNPAMVAGLPVMHGIAPQVHIGQSQPIPMHGVPMAATSGPSSMPSPVPSMPPQYGYESQPGGIPPQHIPNAVPGYPPGYPAQPGGPYPYPPQNQPTQDAPQDAPLIEL